MLSEEYPVKCNFNFTSFKFSEEELKKDAYGYTYILAVFDRIEFYCKQYEEYKSERINKVYGNTLFYLSQVIIIIIFFFFL